MAILIVLGIFLAIGLFFVGLVAAGWAWTGLGLLLLLAAFAVMFFWSART